MRNARIRLYPNIPGTLAELANILRGPQHRVISMTYDGEDNMYADFVEATEALRLSFLPQVACLNLWRGYELFFLMVHSVLLLFPMLPR